MSRHDGPAGLLTYWSSTTPDAIGLSLFSLSPHLNRGHCRPLLPRRRLLVRSGCISSSSCRVCTTAPVGPGRISPGTSWGCCSRWDLHRQRTTFRVSASSVWSFAACCGGESGKSEMRQMRWIAMNYRTAQWVEMLWNHRFQIRQRPLPRELGSGWLSMRASEWAQRSTRASGRGSGRTVGTELNASIS